jgi:hypothetical protein
MRYISFVAAGLFAVTTAALPPVTHNHMDVALVHDLKINQTPSFSTAELYNLTTAFFDAFMAPNNLVEAEKINSTFFSEDVLGRADVTRTFPGREVRPMSAITHNSS